MKKLVILICLLILVRPLVPLIGYAINYDYIKTQLCVNKQKPNMHCNGKCYLMKQLAREADNDKPASQDKKSISWEFEFAWLEPDSVVLTRYFQLHKSKFFFHRFLHPTGWASGIFRPPIL